MSAFDYAVHEKLEDLRCCSALLMHCDVSVRLPRAVFIGSQVAGTCITIRL